jgi:predicted N-acetyltransferase YhbS
LAVTTIRKETTKDIAGREALLDRAFGEARFAKASERLREGRLPAFGLSFVATDKNRVVGTVRLWHVSAGPARPRRATEAAQKLGHKSVLLVGDAPYYGRFGFSAEKTGGLWLPGPFERARLLGRELAPGALDGARGLIGATGAMLPKPALPELVRTAAKALPQAA